MTRKANTLKVGDEVYIPIRMDRPEGDKIPGIVTQVGKRKVRVLVPIRKFVWVPRSVPCRELSS